MTFYSSKIIYKIGTHFFWLGLPCLSFDVIADDLGSNRSEFPHTMYLVAGSQAEKPKDNCVIVMKVHNETCIKYFCVIFNNCYLQLYYIRNILF